MADLYGCLNGFLYLFPASKLLTFMQSKYLSNMSTNFTVSEISSPPVSLRALLTDSLRTYMVCIMIIIEYKVAITTYLCCQVNPHF